MKQLQAELPKLEADVDFLKINKLSAADVLLESAYIEATVAGAAARGEAENH